jgi:hypothetical protein
METNQHTIEPVDEETQYLIDQLYSITPTTMIMPDGSKEEVNINGNIGLIANGYQGIIAWRKKREERFGTRIYSPIIAMIAKNNPNRKENGNEQ